jgi:hypothetical protein
MKTVKFVFVIVALLMKTPKNYLTDQFTIEFDFYKRDREHSSAEGNCGNNRLHVYLSQIFMYNSYPKHDTKLHVFILLIHK